MLIDLHLKDVGPAAEMSIAFRERMNFITGDNGLGKSFLLDVAWWALTRTWARGVVLPHSPPSSPQIAYRTYERPQPVIATYDRRHEAWDRNQGPTKFDDLVIYSRVDGGISMSEPIRSRLRTGHDDRRYAFHFTPEELWQGNGTCEGLIRDWASWQREGSDEFEQLKRVLTTLSPSPEYPLTPGELRRLFISDPKRYPTLVMPHGEHVPVIHASAGMRRIISLAYALVWLWREHLDATKLMGGQPKREIVFLIDEVEAHLHPRWQRRILPALLDVMAALTGDEDVSIQLIAVTHSPLVLASIEPHFDATRDSLWTLDLDGDNHIALEEFPFSRQGDADAWLTSDVFDLEETGSLEAQAAQEKARALLVRDTPDRAEIAEVDALLKAALSSTDRFWVRWSAWRDEQLAASQP